LRGRQENEYSVRIVANYVAAIVKEELELAATFVEEELELAATIVDKRAGGAAMDAYK